MSGCIIHPYGVKPLGNAFFERNKEVMLARQNGLGKFAIVTDDVLLELLSFCSSRDLVHLNCCSRAFYVYSMHNELWRDVMLRTFQGNFMFNKTWKDTYAQSFSKTKGKVPLHEPIKVAGIYSHALHQSWMCRNINLEEQCKG